MTDPVDTDQMDPDVTTEPLAEADAPPATEPLDAEATDDAAVDADASMSPLATS